MINYDHVELMLLYIFIKLIIYKGYIREEFIFQAHSLDNIIKCKI